MQLTTDISGQVALVTGGSSGLGQAIALRLAEAGCPVFIVGRNATTLDETVQQIRSTGGNAEAIVGDLAEAGFAAHAVETAINSAGAINILVNNAAVMYAEGAAVSPRDRWEQMFSINFHAAVEACQATIKHLRDTSADGRIVSISSLASRLPGGGLYGASKSALETYMASLREELERENIRITTIVPGGFTTNLGRDLNEDQQQAFAKSLMAMNVDMTADDDGRTPLFGIPDDIARAVLFAVAQPIYLNTSEMTVRPAININPGSFAAD